MLGTFNVPADGATADKAIPLSVGTFDADGATPGVNTVGTVRCNWIHIQLDDAATGPARVGMSPLVSVAHGRGISIDSGITYSFPSTSAAGPYTTNQIYVSFTDHGAGDYVHCNGLEA